MDHYVHMFSLLTSTYVVWGAPQLEKPTCIPVLRMLSILHKRRLLRAQCFAGEDLLGHRKYYY